MATKKYIPKCIFCGKSGTARSYSNWPTSNPPSLSGTCPSSPDKKHKPRWEEQ